jgi:DNA-binding response OmpR family regulator
MTNKHIILIEDDETLARSLSKAFEESGFDITVATDGGQGLAKVEENKPDLLLLDLTLPTLDGISILKTLRAKAEFEDLPIIILTNRDDIESLEASITSGVHDFIIKHEWKLEDIVGLAKKRLGL